MKSTSFKYISTHLPIDSLVCHLWGDMLLEYRYVQV